MGTLIFSLFFIFVLLFLVVAPIILHERCLAPYRSKIDQMLASAFKKVDLEKMQTNSNTMEVREQLLTLSGVGPKVADCILLFSTLKRFEVFPIDVWVRRVMNDLYIKNEDERKVNNKELEKLAQEKFGNLAGIAQQYLFYWKREA